jgi:TetR/AcrR family transcriptional repressor for divergent bdcA
MTRQPAPVKTSARQRKPAFDREWGIDVAEALFHTRGYDAVGVAELTQAMDIVPPSLYAAYGSKIALFERALTRYATRNWLPLEQLLSDKGTPPDVLTRLFVAAAQHYTQDPVRRGCMVTEAMRADDPEAARIATALAAKGSNAIRDYIAQFVAAGDADRIADYVLLTLRGISSYACLGYSQAKLVECAKVAGRALTAEFKASSRPK